MFADTQPRKARMRRENPWTSSSQWASLPSLRTKTCIFLLCHLPIMMALQKRQLELNPEGRTTTRMYRASFAAVGAAFSTVHIIAWDFRFSRHVEMIIWRTSSVAAAGSCLLIYVTVQLRIRIDGNLIRGRKVKRGQVWTDIGTAMMLFPTMVCRPTNPI